MLPTNPNKMMLQAYLEIFLRRKWWIIIPAVLGTILATVYSYSLAPVYRSSTLILVEPQKIPADYVTTTVTGTIQDRLNTISQQILSRTNLERIITQFGLYKREEKEATSWHNRLKQQVKSWKSLAVQKLSPWVDLKREGPMPLEVLVERMRAEIEVKVMAGGNAFTVAYIGREPLTVMQVTNTLASLFIEENLRFREQRAETTSEFLESQLLEAKERLEEQEKALKEFKERHMGALPVQIDANLRTLDRLQSEIQNINEALNNAEGRKIAVSQLRQELTKIDETLNTLEEQSISTSIGVGIDRSTPSLARMKEELARLQGQFNDNYPDIVILKKQISEAEGELPRPEVLSTADERAPIAASSENEPTAAQRRVSKAGLLTARGELNLYSAELVTLNMEIETLKKRRDKALAMIKEHEKKVDDTFANEQRLMDLTRDYEMSQRKYQSLLDKRLNAKISENLEKRQKGEQFRILDPAHLPQSPFRPDRRKIILVGSLLSSALGIGIVLLQEHLWPRYRKPEDFHGVLDLPVLGTIPRNKITQRRPGRFVTLQEPDSLIAEQYRLLYSQISRLNQVKPQTIFAISSAMKGEGKTVTALNLAFTAARDFGKETLLIEGDFKSPAIAAYLQTKPQGNLVDVLLNGADIHSSIVTLGHSSLSVLPIIQSVRNSSSLLNSPQMKNLVETLKQQYDFILIDAPPILSLSDMNILESMVEGIFLVVRAESTPVDVVVKAVSLLATDKLLGIILNDARQPILEYSRYYYAKNGVKVP